MKMKFCNALKLIALTSTLLVSQSTFASNSPANKCSNLYDKKHWRGAYEQCYAPAKKGHEESQVIMGDLYSYGKGTRQDYTKAIFWYEKAAHQGNHYAMNRAASLYEKTNRPEKAFEWYRTSARKNNVEAMFTTAQFYENGYGVKTNKNHAFHWYREAARQNHYQAQWITATLYHDGVGTNRDMKKAVYWYKRSADNGIANSQYQMGLFYQNGNYVAQNNEKAYHYFNMAASKGHPEAKSIVAKRAMHTRTQAGTQTAAQLYRESAHSGNPDAQYQYGKLVYAGVGTPQNKEEAVQWLERSAEQGHVPAQSYLSRIYLTDPDIANQDKALKWLTTASESHDAQAQYQLGRLYFDGKGGVSKDTTFARQLFTQAAKAGLADAQAYLALCYHQGIGVAQNHHLAQRWYRKAAFKGNTMAQYNLATLYQKGLGVRQDLVRAYSWMSLAAASGFVEAQTAVKVMGKQLTPSQRQAAQALSPVLIRAQS